MRAWRVVTAASVVGAVLFSVGALRPFETQGAKASDSQLVVRARRDAAAKDAALQALSYLERVRSEANPKLLVPARELLDHSFSLRPRSNFAALLAMASLSNASHEFSASVRWARRAIAVDPHNAAPYGLMGDALYELGRYRQADAGYQEMIDIRPDVASYVRAAYSAQSAGRFRDAHEALLLAIEAAPLTGTEAAWLHHQRGDVFYGQRHYRRALRENRLGTKLAPGYIPPTVGMAEALIAGGKIDDAIPLLERAVEKLPALEYFVALGDLYRAQGREVKAGELYAAATRKLRTYRGSGVSADVDFILFYADHGLRPRAALREARAIWADRPTSATADAFAWMLHSAKRDHQALRVARRGLRLARTPDALAHFHTSAIAHALGRSSQSHSHARTALRLDPAFSLLHLEQASKLAARGRA